MARGKAGFVKPMFERAKWKIIRGDNVAVTAGRDAGATGTVLKVIRDERRPAVIVEGCNLSKKHIKRTEDNPGGTISIETPIHYSNVRLVDPVTRAPVRVSWRFLEDGSKVRVTVGKKASGSVVPRPEVLAQRRTPAPLPGPKDTPASVAARVTHVPGGNGPSVMRPLQEVLRSGVSKGGAGAGAGAGGSRGFAASAVARW